MTSELAYVGESIGIAARCIGEVDSEDRYLVEDAAGDPRNGERRRAGVGRAGRAGREENYPAGTEWTTLQDIGGDRRRSLKLPPW